jgi:pimeloyl-ACP methyl ester carboxylesterase
MFIYKILKKPFFGNYMVKWRNPLNEQAQKEWKKINTRSTSGGNINGLFATSNTKEQKATLILGHPMGKEAKGYFIKNGYTDLYRNNGFNVLIFDINGFGESTNGSFSYYKDIIAIGDVAKSITPTLPIGYHGISLGGQWATIAFADAAHQYNFAIIESAATTLDDFWIHFPTANKALKILNIFLPRYKKKIKMIERIKEAKNLDSILFIYSANDDWTPISMGEKYHKNCAIPSTLWTMTDAKHAAAMKSGDKEAYCNKILSYFNNAINK